MCLELPLAWCSQISAPSPPRCICKQDIFCSHRNCSPLRLLQLHSRTSRGGSTDRRGLEVWLLEAAMELGQGKLPLAEGCSQACCPLWLLHHSEAFQKASEPTGSQPHVSQWVSLEGTPVSTQVVGKSQRAWVSPNKLAFPNKLGPDGRN